MSAATKPAANVKSAKGGKPATAEKPGKLEKPGKPGPTKSGPAKPGPTKSAPAKSEPAGPSFMTRFTAWWNGYELQASAATGPASKPKPTPESAASDAADEAPAEPPADARMRIAQMVWSAGFLWPGGEDLALELAKPLGLDASSTLIEIGAGLGGGTRAIAQKLGTYVTGFDLDSAVVAEAMAQAEVHSLEDKAKVLVLDPLKPNLRKDFFRAALVREALYQVADKKVLLDSVLESLKKDQSIVIFDLFAGAAEPAKLVADWISLEPYPVHLCQVDEIKAVLTARSVEIRVEQDDSELYCAMALRAWGDFVGRLGNESITKELVIPMVREVELWARRIAALQSGGLKVWRVAGIKRAPVK